MSSREFAFAFIKPDGMAAGLTEKIRALLVEDGKLSVVMEADFSITPDQAAVHYDKGASWCQRVGTQRWNALAEKGCPRKDPTELGRDILAAVRASITTAPVHAFILSGENANAELRRIVGATDPASADPGTIRALSSDSYKDAEKEMRPVRNIIHASETPGDARREIMNLWPSLTPLMQFLLFP